MRSRFQFTDDHLATYEVKRLCEGLELNRSSYYKWLAGRPELPSSTGTGSWRSATIMTLAQGGILMKRWAASGEAFADRYFRCSDGLIARAAGINNMPQVLTGLIQNGEFTRILQRLDD